MMTDHETAMTRALGRLLAVANENTNDREWEQTIEEILAEYSTYENLATFLLFIAATLDGMLRSIYPTTTDRDMWLARLLDAHPSDTPTGRRVLTLLEADGG